MKLCQHPNSQEVNESAVQLVLCFGSRSVLQSSDVNQVLKNKFPSAEIVTCSTAGEIWQTEVLDDSVSVTAIEFKNTPVISHCINIDDFGCSYDAGKALIAKFDMRELLYVLVLSDGSKVNGSELVRGLNEALPERILITGGLAGDGNSFNSTVVGLNSQPQEGEIAAIGFYGTNLLVGHGSHGGWETFGLEKIVTRSKNNILYEINDKNALNRYKHYLGPDSELLPGAALLFPLSVVLPYSSDSIVRTILSIDPNEGSMTFAGDIPEGSRVRFMRANFDKLTGAASIAASKAQNSNIPSSPDFALLISCVGRKLVLQSRTDEEVEAVDEEFNHKTILAGFYSYGEISPGHPGGACQLHNQTMTITTFYEAE